MSTQPDPTPREQQDPAAPQPWPEPPNPAPEFLPASPAPVAQTHPDEQGREQGGYLANYDRFLPRPPRFPNLADVLLMLVLLGFGWLISGAFTYEALHYHLFDVYSQKQAMNDVRYTLGGQMVWYLITLSFWVLLFSRVWQTGFWNGLEFRAREALRLRWQLVSAALACFALAILDGVLIPGPKEAPIDQVFRMPGAGWALFAFGVTLAPLIEETIFRGFLLPALCTAWDWTMEHLRHHPPLPPDEHGRTQWTMPAMFIGAVLTSIPFALMHGYQIGYAFGPFILLFCVSLVLCWVRLSRRSVAASTVVHACYNLLLFVLMIWGTSGFRHMDHG